MAEEGFKHQALCLSYAAWSMTPGAEGPGRGRMSQRHQAEMVTTLVEMTLQVSQLSTSLRDAQQVLPH